MGNGQAIQSAKPVNWLLGRWRVEQNDCVKPEYSFWADEFVNDTDVDGVPAVFHFKPITYDVEGNIVWVDFGSARGLSGWQNSEGKVKIHGIQRDVVAIIHPKSEQRQLKLFRCPRSN